ncbi:hypothetical protein KP509_15G064300 [Ceratopteris richardii]|uniref:Uncharacterized protein n=1 Tax=Ceratopteris richardii TaxID=49495 RepID=A0A8T2TAK1_CERRI|nr:hypothetical protein KP509_15G064300 [Ceratopteris richardii]
MVQTGRKLPAAAIAKDAPFNKSGFLLLHTYFSTSRGNACLLPSDIQSVNEYGFVNGHDKSSCFLVMGAIRNGDGCTKRGIRKQIGSEESRAA